MFFTECTARVEGVVQVHSICLFNDGGEKFILTWRCQDC
jgi:hypothetical protein